MTNGFEQKNAGAISRPGGGLLGTLRHTGAARPGRLVQGVAEKPDAKETFASRTVWGTVATECYVGAHWGRFKRAFVD